MSKIKEMPLNERPREKAIHYGIESLSTNEILAIIIGSGTRDKSAIDIADELLSEFKGLVNLSRTNLNKLVHIKGINTITSLRLMACFELAVRLIKFEDTLCINMKDNVNYLAKKYQKLLFRSNQEEMHLILFNKNDLIGKEKMLYKGTKSLASVSIEEIINEVKTTNFRKFVIIHNHPKLTSRPSDHDLVFTMDLINAAKKNNLQLLDHIIISQTSTNSMLGLFE